MRGAEVKEIRARAGLLQVPFAEKLGVHPVTLSRFESDAQPIPLTVELALCELDRRLSGNSSAKTKKTKKK